MTDGTGTGGDNNNGGQQQQSQQGAPAVWTDTIEDQSMRDWAVNKGYHKSTKDEVLPGVLQSYHNLEKLFGAEKAGRTVEIPDFDKADAAVKAAFYQRLGAPKAEADYKLELPQTGLHPEFEAWTRKAFLDAGVTNAQAAALSKGWGEFVAKLTTAETQADQQRFAEEDRGLKQEWGQAYDDKIAKASAAAKAFGIKAETLDAMQKVAGYGDVMRHFSMVADKMGEHNFVQPNGGGGGSNTMTPAEADAALKQLNADKDWMTAWLDKGHPNHKAAVERKQFLTSFLAPAV